MFFKKKVEKQGTDYTLPIGWRNNMWVVTPDGIGIIFKLGVKSEVHLVDTSGVTVAVNVYDINVLRQASFAEIPSPRRRHISKEKAFALGYK